jgi:hypothetical protein
MKRYRFREVVISISIDMPMLKSFTCLSNKLITELFISEQIDQASDNLCIIANRERTQFQIDRFVKGTNSTEHKLLTLVRSSPP